MYRVGAVVEAVASQGAKRAERENFCAPLAASFRLVVSLAAFPMSKNFWERLGIDVFGSLSSNL